MRVALYAPTSTDDGRQELANQAREPHAYAERMGWNVVAEYLDQVSGRKTVRPQFSKALEDARKRRYDVLLSGPWTGSPDVEHSTRLSR